MLAYCSYVRSKEHPIYHPPRISRLEQVPEAALLCLGYYILRPVRKLDTTNLQSPGLQEQFFVVGSQTSRAKFENLGSKCAAAVVCVRPFRKVKGEHASRLRQGRAGLRTHHQPEKLLIRVVGFDFKSYPSP